MIMFNSKANEESSREQEGRNKVFWLEGGVEKTANVKSYTNTFSNKVSDDLSRKEKKREHPKVVYPHFDLPNTKPNHLSTETKHNYCLCSPRSRLLLAPHLMCLK